MPTDTTPPVAPELAAFSNATWKLNPEVTMQTGFGDVLFELYPGAAPITVSNFLAYVNTGFYDGLLFHRVNPPGVPVIQGGGFSTGLTPVTPDYSPILLETNVGLSNLRGTLAMARTNDPNSATSQFFVNLNDANTFLDYRNVSSPGYAVFGAVKTGLSVIDAIGAVPTSTQGLMADVPVTEAPILTMTETRHGVLLSTTGYLSVGAREAGSTWEYSLDGGTSWISGTGGSLTLAAGAYEASDLRIRQTDAAGNVSGVGTLGADFVVGNASTVCGTGSGDTLAGTSGNDVVYALGGNDTLDGGAGNDTLDGGSGVDTLIGGAGNDVYAVRDVGDVVLETDSSLVTGGVDTVKSYLSAAYVLAANIENGIAAGSGATDLTGNALDNTIYAGAGNNVLDGGGGTNVVSYLYASAGVTVDISLTGAQDTVGSGTDTLVNFQKLVGSAFADTLLGGSGNDTLDGGSGNDTLDGGAGLDTLTGGSGNDVYDVRDSGDVVIEALTGGSDTVRSYLSGAAYVLAANIEDGIVALSGAADLSGNALDNTLYAGAGDNVLDGGAGSNTASYLYASTGVTVDLGLTIAQNTGGSGSDTLVNIQALVGSAFADTLFGAGANDTLDGGTGDDTLIGGAGNDVYAVRDVGDVVLETDAILATGGVDTVKTYLSGTYVLGANIENGIVAASGAANLTGNALDNTIYAGAGNNTLDGAAGNNVVSYLYASAGVTVDFSLTSAQNTVGSGTDTLLNFQKLVGSSFADTLSGGASDDTLDGGSGNDTLSGGDGSNQLSGGDGVDVLLGGGGADTLFGDAGNDSLDGAAGIDTLSGGAGSDIYYVRDAGDLVLEADASALTGGVDTVRSYISAYVLATNVEDGIVALSGAADLSGNALDNTLYAGDGDNVLNGAAGSNTVSYLYASTGVTVNLALTGVQNTVGSGSDTLLNFQALAGSAFADTLQGGAANDTLDGGAGNDTLIGGDGSNVLSGGDGVDVLVGGSGADSLYGDAGVDTLSGAAGADVLDGGAGVDTMTGGAGSDVYYVRDTGDVVLETDAILASGGTDTVVSYLGGSNLLGDNIEDGILFNSGAADMTGNALDNTIFAGAGNNTLDGGAGRNAVSYFYAGAGVTVSLALSTAQSTGGSGTDTLAHFQILAGSSFADTLSGGAANDVLEGNGGNDTLSGGEGANQLFGGDGVDVLLSGGGDDNLNGGAGDDTLDAGAGADVLDGGIGIDTLIGGAGGDIYYLRDAGDLALETGTSVATGGYDTVVSFISGTPCLLAANVEDGIVAATGAADMTGNALNNTLYAGAGNNVLNGGAGTNTVSYKYASAGVKVSLALTTAQNTVGSGTDTLSHFAALLGSDYADTLTGGTGADTLDGGAGNDVLNGGNGANQLLGAAGADTLTGGTGADVLDGGAGSDLMTGGGGDDLYYVRDANDRVSETTASTTTGGRDMVVSLLAAYTLGANIENGLVLAAGNANLTGNTLDNTLFAGAGNNVLDGAGGHNYASYVYASAAVNVSLSKTTAQATGGSGSDTLKHFEGIIGSSFGDHLYGDAASNGLYGGDGNDVLDGLGAADGLFGGNGDDTYYLRDKGDVLKEDSARGGNDLVLSFLADYTLGSNLEDARVMSTTAANLTGNTLANVLYAGSGNNVLNGAGGLDTVSYAYSSAGVTVSLDATAAQATGGSGKDTLSAFENLTGSAHSDKLTGTTGANVIDGGAGADTMTGGAGNDTYLVRDTGDKVLEASGGGTDLAISYLASYTLAANVENGAIMSAGTASMTGNSLDNIMTAGSGKNLLTGGGGHDIFVFSALADTSALSATADTISDFLSGDRIDLSLLDANTGAAGNNAFSGTLVSDFTAAGQLKLVSGVLYGNTDSNLSTAEFAINLTHVTALSAHDFIL